LAERVLYQSFRRKRSPREIAARLGCTPRRVRQILAEHRPLVERLSV
jgi:DNA-binding CsgD family transcriptional regulator